MNEIRRSERIKDWILFGVMVVVLTFLLVCFGVTQTSMGPIKTPQVNQNLYVGQSGYATIQSAVNYACRTGNKSFQVVIQQGISPSDQIANVTGGCTTTFIDDYRTNTLQRYSWSGTAYIPLLPFGAGNATYTRFVIATAGETNPTISGLPTTAITWIDAPGSVDYGRLVHVSKTVGTYGGLSLTGLAPQSAGGPLSHEYLHCDPANNFQCIFAGDVAIQGAVSATTGTINGSPICTSATGCSSSNQVYPAAGIAVSTGSTWGTSIPQNSLATYPAAGVPVSTGTAWGTSIAQANIPLLNAASNNFTGSVTSTVSIASGVRLSGSSGGDYPDTTMPDIYTNTTNGDLLLSAKQPGSLFLNYGHGNGFTYFGNGATTEVAEIDNIGNMTLYGHLAVGQTDLELYGNTTGVDFANSGARMSWNYSGGNAETDFYNVRPSTGSPGGFRWYSTVAGTTPATSSQIALLDASGNVSFNGNITGATTTANGSIVPAQAAVNHSYFDFTSGQTRIISTGPNTTTQGGFLVQGWEYNGSGNFQNPITYINCTPSNPTCTFGATALRPASRTIVRWLIAWNLLLTFAAVYFAYIVRQLKRQLMELLNPGRGRP